MKASGLVHGTALVACIASAAALAQPAFPETLRGCWSGEIGADPALLQWAPQEDALGGWAGFATLSPAAREPFIERHSLTPPRPGVVNLGWRYCHPERERRKSLQRCYWMRGPSGDLENHVTFDVADGHLQIDSHAFGETETLFRGQRAPCPAAE